MHIFIFCSLYLILYLFHFMYISSVFVFYNICIVHGADLTHISLLVIYSLYNRVCDKYKSWILNVQVKKMSTHLSRWHPPMFRQRCILCVWRLIREVFNSVLWWNTGGVINRSLQATTKFLQKHGIFVFWFWTRFPTQLSCNLFKSNRELIADQRKSSAPNHWVIIHPQVG